MSIHVSDILAKSSSQNGSVSPVDIVMGDDWGEFKLGNSMRLSLLGLMLKKQQQLGAASLRGGSPALRHVSFQITRRRPQAMVKVIRNGGTTNARGMRDQMSYLEKDGDAKLERSEGFFGMELDDEAQEDLIHAWGLDRLSDTKSDKTTHFVVSFPTDTDRDAAYRSGRAWAEEIFASSNYGDVYDYYTAFHTDRAHPHMHVVVNRRGLEHGNWLKVSRRSEINYNELRAVQVEVSWREGIFLEATPRFARGVSDRSVTDAEYRRAEKERREPQAPSHTPYTAIRAAASIAIFAQQIDADANLLDGRYPEISQKMRDVSQTILEGKEVLASNERDALSITPQQAAKGSNFIMSRRQEILDDIKEVDDEVSELPLGFDRSKLERMVAAMKTDAASFMPDVPELQPYTQNNNQGYYQGVEAEDPLETEIKTLADAEVVKLAEEAGIDAPSFMGRFDKSEPAPEGLADQWRNDELEDIQKNLTYQDRSNQTELDQLAQTAYDELHRNALQTYREAERELEAHRVRKKELTRLAKLVKDGLVLTGDAEFGFNQLVKDTLHITDLKKLEVGTADVFKHITQDEDVQRSLSHKYLEAEHINADSARKLQLQSAVTKVEHEMQAATRALDKDRGMDY